MTMYELNHQRFQYKSLFFLCVLILTSLISTKSNAGSSSCEQVLIKAAVPRDAYYLPEEDALQLNYALKKYNVIRLKPGGDYTKSLSIKMKSNQAIYGFASTKVSNIIITPGSQNIIVSDIHSKKIIFPTSNQITSKNCFNRIRTLIEVDNTKLEDNLFTDIQGGIVNIDNSKRGYIRNNRFIKTMTHTAWPALTVLGNSDEPSYGNHFVWTNILGPLGDSIVIDNQKNIAFTGIDIESWSWGEQVRQKVPIYYPAAINVSNTDFLSIFMSHGGNLRIKDAQYYNLDAKNIFLQGSFVQATSAPGMVLGKSVEALLAINTRSLGHVASNKNTKIIELFKDDKPQVTNNFQTIVNGKLSTTLQPATNKLLLKEKNIYANWLKPTFGDVLTKISNHQKENLPIYNNASDDIQSLINKHGIAELEEGIYYLSNSLKLKDGQGIIGAGQDKTILIAKNNNINMIVGANHIDNEINKIKSTLFSLADLTIDGGKNGIYHAASGSGKSAQYHRSVVSHVTFRNMSNAAIMLDSIYAWDNNFLDNINFINCNAAIKQRPDPLYKGGDKPGTTYMDKNVCYRCQFIGNNVALDMPGKRGNGLNAFISSQFKHNGKVMEAIHPLSNFFANSIFINNKGNPSIETNHMLGFVHSDFHQTIPGSIFQRFTHCNGCNFNMGHTEANIISSNKNMKSERNFFVNSNLTSSDSKNIYSGLILGSTYNKSVNDYNVFIDKNITSPLFLPNKIME